MINSGMYIYNELNELSIREKAWREIQDNIRNCNVARLAIDLNYSPSTIEDLMNDVSGRTIHDVRSSISCMFNVLFKLSGAKKAFAVVGGKRYVLGGGTDELEELLYDLFKKARMNNVGLTLKDFGSITGINPTILSRIKRKQLSSPRVGTCLSYIVSLGETVKIVFDDYVVKPPICFRLQDHESPVTFLVSSIKARGQLLYAQNNMTREELMLKSGCNIQEVRSFLCEDSRVRQSLDLTLRMAKACGVDVVVAVS